MTDDVTVVLMRRIISSVSTEERRAIEAYFAGSHVNYVTISARDAEEHLREMQRIQPGLVILPSEVPIPQLAMDAGFRHVSFSNGQLRRLLRMDLSTVPLVPLRR